MEEDNDEQQRKQFHINFPAVQLANKNYSLEADIVTGWKPKNKILGPIPFNFDSAVTDAIIDELTSFGGKHKQRVVYLGFRYANSYKIHQQMNHQYRFKHEGIINGSFHHMAAYFRKFHANFKTKSPGRLFKGMNPTLKQTQQIIFDSNFQSGNLDAVIKVGDCQYDIFMRVDTNTRGHVQWFNFTVKNNGKSKIKINIVNFRKFKTLYNRGMKPYVYSQYLKQTKQIGWVQGGNNVKYEKQKLRYSFLEEDFHEESISYNCLKFEYNFETDWETVQFAYCPPFTYSQMLQIVRSVKKGNDNEERNFISQETLCESLGGVDLPLLTITDPEIQRAKKKCILVWGRIHPGETCGSHMLNGFLKYICSESQEASNLRKNVVFKVIPMLNPDGVIAGNFRTSLCGRDLNRQFRTNQTFLIPQVKAVKDLVLQLRSQFKSRLIFFLDMHGHSVKKNVFLYGPEYEIWQTNYYKTRIFPKIISSKTQIFRFYSCLFRIADFKRTTARAVLLNHIPHCYTIQASTGSYYSSEQKKDVNFTPQLWEFTGKTIAESVSDYIKLLYDTQLTKQQRSQKINELKAYKKPHRKTSQQRNGNQKFQTRLLSVSSTQKHKNIEKKQNEGIQKLNDRALDFIEQLKREEKARRQQREIDDQRESDKFSEGGSDSDGSEEDIPEDQLNKLHRQIIDSMKQFKEKFYNTKKKDHEYSLKGNQKKNLQKNVRESIRLKSTRQSRGIQMIASLRKKAEELQKAENILLGKKIKSQVKNRTTNIEKPDFPYHQNHKIKISFHTYIKQYGKKDRNEEEKTSPLL